MSEVKAVFFDLEGPLSPQDNAYEVASRISRGKGLFERLSRFDDELAVSRKSYDAGSTLSFITPFLVAENVGNSQVEQVSKQARTVKGAKETVSHLEKEKIEVFIVSTSFQPHAYSIGRKIGVRQENIFCTEIDLDKLAGKLDKGLKEFLAQKKEEIINGSNYFLKDFFFKKLPGTGYGNPLKKVKVMGGSRKAKIVEEKIFEKGISMDNVAAIGDSITDREMLTKVGKGGGLAIVFNGNMYALRHGNIGVASSDLRALRIILDSKDPLETVKKWEKGREKYKNHLGSIPREILNKDLLKIIKNMDHFPYIHFLEESLEKFVDIHESFRKNLRGEAGKLG